MKYSVLTGRILFSMLFIVSGISHLTGEGIDLAAKSGVPLASLAVPLSGLISLAGGLSILSGYKTRIGAWLIILFLVPVTLSMHRFWTVSDPMMSQIQMIMFMKNITLIGAALIITYFGSGPLSLDGRIRK